MASDANAAALRARDESCRRDRRRRLIAWRRTPGTRAVDLQTIPQRVRYFGTPSQTCQEEVPQRGGGRGGATGIEQPCRLGRVPCRPGNDPEARPKNDACDQRGKQE